MCQWLMAKACNNIMQDAEDKGLRDWRQRLLQNISGDVLELGCGTGANLEFYPNTVNRLVLIEPSVHMRKKLQVKILTNKQANIELLNDKAENLSLPDASFDAVVCTLVRGGRNLALIRATGEPGTPGHRALGARGWCAGRETCEARLAAFDAEITADLALSRDYLSSPANSPGMSM